MIRSVVNTRTLRRAASGFITLFLVTAVAAHAQFSGGVQGTVQDSSGGAVPSTTVTLTNVDNKVTETAVSGDAGVYRFASLAPGNYQVSAAAPGFSTSKSAFTLNANETRNVPIMLAIGSVSTQVEVTAQQPLLDPPIAATSSHWIRPRLRSFRSPPAIPWH